MTHHENRLANGWAHMICSDCGAKLYDFDGFKDQDVRCPWPGEINGTVTYDRCSGPSRKEIDTMMRRF